jgi:hypothetical protein
MEFLLLDSTCTSALRASIDLVDELVVDDDDDCAEFKFRPFAETMMLSRRVKLHRPVHPHALVQALDSLMHLQGGRHSPLQRQATTMIRLSQFLSCRSKSFGS